MAEERCPYIIRRQAGDESYDTCELDTAFCLTEHEHYCTIWEEIKKEE